MTSGSSVGPPSGSSPTMRGYRKLVRIASGGMGTVYVGVLEGALGFRQLVALKEAHPHLVEDEDVRRTLAEEARLAARIQHANVVEVRDVIVSNRGITLVMPYIDGGSLSALWRGCLATGTLIPLEIALRIVLDAAAGLSAAHELKDETGMSLGIVHRDVSPQNLLVGADGVTRVTDFGVAKHRRDDGYSTSHGLFKGKLAYAAPESLRAQDVDGRVDVFAMGIVLWELLARERLFYSEAGNIETAERVQKLRPKPVAAISAEFAPLDPILAGALEKSKTARTASMADFAAALEQVAKGKLASHRDVAAFLTQVLGPRLEERRALVRERFRTDVTPVDPTSRGSSPPVLPTLEPVAPVTLGAVSTDRVRTTRGAPQRWIAAGVALVAVTLGGFALRRSMTTGADAAPSAGAPAATSITAPVDKSEKTEAPMTKSTPPSETGRPSEAPAPFLDLAPGASPTPNRPKMTRPRRAIPGTEPPPPSPPPNPYLEKR